MSSKESEARTSAVLISMTVLVAGSEALLAMLMGRSDWPDVLDGARVSSGCPLEWPLEWPLECTDGASERLESDV